MPYLDDEDGDTPCPEKEGECPYYGIEFPEIPEEDRLRIREWSSNALKRRGEEIRAHYASHPEHDP